MNVTVRYEDLPCTIGAFTVEHDDHYTVVVNARLSCDRQRDSVAHELRHIAMGDFDGTVDVDRLEMERHNA